MNKFTPFYLEGQGWVEVPVVPDWDEPEPYGDQEWFVARRDGKWVRILVENDIVAMVVPAYRARLDTIGQSFVSAMARNQGKGLMFSLVPTKTWPTFWEDDGR